jgi:hypothetical protein
MPDTYRPAPDWSHLNTPRPLSLWRMLGGTLAFLATLATGFVIAQI